MKITLTGSLGNINVPLIANLMSKGHTLTVISTDAAKESLIQALGAKAAIGSMEDPAFLSNTFAGAEAVYLMEPPVRFFDQQMDIITYYGNIARSFVNAVLDSGVQHLVHLSSVGAHTSEGIGMLHFHNQVETILQELPAEISITHVRALAIYYNLLNFIPGIKHTGKMSANYGAEDIIPWVSPFDIAQVVAEELEAPAKGRKFRYVVSEEVSCNDAARILGSAIGMPDLKWELISDEEQAARMAKIGMATHQIAGLVEMNAAMHSGTIFSHYEQHKPSEFGKVKMSDYAKEFARVYNS